MSELLEIGRHHLGPRGALGELDEAMDVFNRPERFLPQLKLCRSLQLGKPRLQMQLQ
jgi:hypothetical protein